MATDLKLWCKETAENYCCLSNLQQAMMNLADVNKIRYYRDIHILQRAQPVTFGHWCLAYVEMFNRDIGRLKECFIVEILPIRSGRISRYSLPN